jgi:hypothetical protein
LEAGIYRWSIILADTDFFQQSESVSAEADYIGQALFIKPFAVFMLLSILEPLSTKKTMQACTHGDNPFLAVIKQHYHHVHRPACFVLLTNKQGKWKSKS